MIRYNTCFETQHGKIRVYYHETLEEALIKKKQLQRLIGLIYNQPIESDSPYKEELEFLKSEMIYDDPVIKVSDPYLDFSYHLWKYEKEFREDFKDEPWFVSVRQGCETTCGEEHKNLYVKVRNKKQIKKLQKEMSEYMSCKVHYQMAKR